ncbi:SET domain-containing protein [Tieghemostelium lacteum]|uniref:SET domain-containing protein n=1 Tax=Tieghemostelium lacteum TaxID=361077 RepID=A0A151Z3J5_TIELA|nr:SET domain-containing protein [Tieghemostelium lacteum]|eukprot:KYQ88521.1 SET domain-containing protein [Tieghemostelium lacteum]
MILFKRNLQLNNFVKGFQRFYFTSSSYNSKNIQTNTNNINNTTSTAPNKNSTDSKKSENEIITDLYKFIIGNRLNLEIRQCKGDQKGKGRGLFYSGDSILKKNELLYSELPFVSFQSVVKNVSDSKQCTHCLGVIKESSSRGCGHDSCNEHYCSVECSEESMKQYHQLLCEGSGFDKIKKQATIEKRRFPLLAAKILAKIMLDIHENKSIQNSWFPLQMLSFAKKPAPLEWKDDYTLFKNSLLTSESSQKRFDYTWFTRVMQILYLNTVGINVGSLEPTVSTPESGIGLYFLSSFINHSCDPNAVMTFPTNSETKVKLLKDIHPGDEILISYGDNTKDIVDRKSHLFDNYGFDCQCTKCSSELPPKKKKIKNI